MTIKKKKDLNAVVTKKGVAKVLCVVDQGLCNGLGIPKPGHMCVEAAVTFALYGARSEAPKTEDEVPFGDSPLCVGEPIRQDKIALNDAFGWVSNISRAEGLRRIAIAQLGSAKISYAQWGKALKAELEKTYVPFLLEKELNKINKISKNSATQKMYSDLIRTLIKEDRPDSIYAFGEDINPNIGFNMDMDDAIEYSSGNEEELCIISECAVQACIKLNTKGSRFLYLTKLSKKKLKALLRG